MLCGPSEDGRVDGLSSNCAHLPLELTPAGCREKTDHLREFGGAGRWGWERASAGFCEAKKRPRHSDALPAAS